MKRKLNINYIIIYGIILTLCQLPLRGYCQSAEAAVNSLVNMGFENVAWIEDDEERVYTFENSAYRLNGVGIGKAVDEIQKRGLPKDKPCRLIVLDNNVPMISLYYQPILGDTIPSVARRDWDVSYDIDNSWSKVRKEAKQNSSLYKIDFLIYPQVNLKNLVITQIYQVLFYLSPAIEVSLWKGMKVTGQLNIAVYNDGYSERLNKLHPGFVTLQQTVRLPFVNNTWATATLGMFNNERVGGDLKLLHVLKRDQRFSFEGRVGLTATGYWNGFEYTYGTKKRLTWTLGGNFYWPQFNVQASLKAEQYLLQEKGVRFDLIRHFRYASIGFYAMKAEGAKSNGGFRFQIALPPYKHKRGKYGRVAPSRNMGIAYNAGNEQYYYKGYRTNPSENIMQSNNFNPYYIKSELLNF